MLELFKTLWAGWNAATRGLFKGITAGAMAVGYFLAIGPVALGFRLRGKKLLDHAPADPAATSYWNPRPGKPMTMDEAARQF